MTRLLACYAANPLVFDTVGWILFNLFWIVVRSQDRFQSHPAHQAQAVVIRKGKCTVEVGINKDR